MTRILHSNEFVFNRVSEPKGANKIGPKNANEQFFSGDYDNRIDTLVRETIQNPLDHPINLDKPVEVIFKERIIPLNSIPFSTELKVTIQALLNELSDLKKSDDGIVATLLPHYTKALALLENEEISLLQISDYNTKGLIGSRKNVKTNLGRFLGADGYFDDESVGGGSGGLGKFAPFQVSQLGFCMYSSYNIKSEFIYYGWAKYFSHKIGKKWFTGEINIGAKNNDVLKLKAPITNSSFMSERSELGTDVYALGFSPSEMGVTDWIPNFTKSVIRNFFGAIISGKLVVKIQNKVGQLVVIGPDTIESHLNLFNENQKKREKNGLMADGLVFETITNYLKPNKEFVSTYNQTPILGKGCKFKISLRDDYSREVSYMRGPQMYIYSEKTAIGDLPYTASFECLSRTGNSKLRNLEDSKHREWKYNKSDEGKRIRKEIKKFVEECISKIAMHETDGEFSISGSNLISIGKSSSNRIDSSQPKSTKLSKVSTAIIYPINTKSESISKSSFGSSMVVDKKGRKKMIASKKVKYKHPKTEVKLKKEKESKKSDPKPKNVDDFNASIFKNDQIKNEYHLFIESSESTLLKNLSLDILQDSGKIAEIDFVERLTSAQGELIKRNVSKKDNNHFEEIPLKKGLNKFIVKTRFNKKVQIILK